MTRTGIFVLAVMALLGACRTVPERAAEPVSLAIENVTVIDPQTRRVLPARSVYVEGGRIVAVAAAKDGARYAPRTRVDGTGKFLIPGLMDMHLHLFLPEPAGPALNLLLANGVTGIREMASDCWAPAGAKAGCLEDYRALQAAVRSGETPGPELLSLTSAMIMGPTRLKVPRDLDPTIAPTGAEEARRVVRYLKARGLDRIKTHDSVPTEAFLALMAEAKAAGIEVSGHVPFRPGSLGAARLGYGSIEHARDLLYDCGRYGPEFRRASADFSDGKPGAARPGNVERLSRTVSEYDPALCAAFLAQLAGTGVHYTPTHVTREMEARAGEAAYRNDPRRKYILAARNRNWEKDLDETAALPPEEKEALRRFFEHGLLITGMAYRAGVPIMAGTDASDTMILPGFSLHNELSLLAKAGLPPMEVLRSATAVPAAYLRRGDVLGGVAAGREADLVLLRANPLADIGNTRSIEAVIADGRLYDRAALDALLAQAERAASASR